MLDGLDSLEHFNKESESKEPTSLEMIYYLFWERGMSLKEIEELPLPYIFSVLKAHIFIKEKEAEELKKAQRSNK